MPAAAVRRREQALFGITGHKGRVGGKVSQFVKAPGSTRELLLILLYLSVGGEIGTLGGAVKCVDIKRNAGGENGSLSYY